MTSNFVITHEPPRAAWQAFADTHADANIFHTPAWQEVVKKTKGWAPRTLAAWDENQQKVLALWPSTLTSVFGGVLKPFSTRAVLFGGALATPEPIGAQALQSLIRAYNREARGRFLFTEIRHNAEATAQREILSGAGFVWEPHLNFLIDLQRSEETLWASLSSSARRNVRAAQKSGVEAIEIQNHAGITQFYDLLTHVYRHAGVHLTDASLFHAAFDVLGPRGEFRVVLAMQNGQAIGGRASLLYKNCLYDWYAGADRAAAKFYPNDFLVWELLRWGREHGFRVFDFGGAGHPEKPYGVRDFKARFGGELVNYGRSVKIHAPWYSLAARGYKLYQKRLGRHT